MNTEKMLILLLLVQIVLLIIGVIQILQGSLYFGLFNVICNLIGLGVNVKNLITNSRFKKQ